MFEKQPTWSNYELRSLEVPLFQYPARIYELKRRGHVFITSRDDSDPQKYYYTYMGIELDT